MSHQEFKTVVLKAWPKKSQLPANSRWSDTRSFVPNAPRTAEGFGALERISQDRSKKAFGKPSHFVPLCDSQVAAIPVGRRTDNADQPGYVEYDDLRQQVQELTLMLEGLVGKVDGPLSGDASEMAPLSAPTLKPEDLRRLIKFRSQRRRAHSSSLLEGPGWEMLLDLAAVAAEGGSASVSTICASTGASLSTTLRKLDQLEQANLIKRCSKDCDKRRVFVVLTADGLNLVHSQVVEYASFFHTLHSAKVK